MTYERLRQLPAQCFQTSLWRTSRNLLQNGWSLAPYLDRVGKPGGRCKLNVEDQLLVALEYWREYCTQFHIAESWGISEATVCRIIQKVENLLLQSGEFRLPGKKQVYQTAYE